MSRGIKEGEILDLRTQSKFEVYKRFLDMQNQVSKALGSTIIESNSLVFNAEDVLIECKFQDELSMFRARKVWIELFNNYFLLDQERDFELELVNNLNENCFKIVCNFTSACGRYAFWRMINKQAPEVEEQLLNSISGKEIKTNWGAESDAWSFSTLEEQLKLNDDTQSLLGKIFGLFQ